MRRLCVAFGIAVALASGAHAEFVARAKDFKCLKAFTPIPGKSFVVYNRNAARLHRAVRIATEEYSSTGSIQSGRSFRCSPSRRW